MNDPVQTAALTSTPQTVNVAARAVPFTVTLSSTAVGRKIRVSTNGGTANSFFEPTVDGTSTDAISVFVMAPITHVEFTGTIGDVYRVQ